MLNDIDDGIILNDQGVEATTEERQAMNTASFEAREEADAAIASGEATVAEKRVNGEVNKLFLFNQPAVNAILTQEGFEQPYTDAELEAYPASLADLDGAILGLERGGEHTLANTIRAAVVSGYTDITL